MQESLTYNNDLLRQVVSDATKIGRSLYDISRYRVEGSVDPNKILPPRFTNLNEYKKGNKNYSSYHQDAQSRIKNIDFDWGIITLMKLIDVSYKDKDFSCYEEMEYMIEAKKWHPYIVQAIHEILAIKYSSKIQDQKKERDFDKLSRFIFDCLFLERVKEYNDVVPFWGDPGEFYSSVVFTPKIPIEEDINNLLNNLSKENLAKIIDIIWYGINQDKTVIELMFKEYRFLKHIPVTGVGKNIWLVLHKRLSLLFKILETDSDNLIFVEKSFLTTTMYSCATSQTIIYNPSDYRELYFDTGTTDSHNLFPLYISEGYAWLSLRTLIASIPLWLSQEIERNNDIRKKVVSESFEVKVINLLRQNNYIAGEVTKNGFWRNSSKGENLLIRNKPKFELNGQIDVLAKNSKGDIIVLECKSINPFGAAKNVAGKIKNDDSSWREKLARKVKWVERVFNQRVKYSAVIQEGYVYKSPSEMNEDIPIINYSDLEKNIISN